MNAYPPAPWSLKGDAMQTVQLVEIERVRSLIPARVHILPVLPGKTLGGIGTVRYGAGSVLEYSELVVVAALTFYKGRVGAWISHIYVDSAASVSGGRNIWGLPKQLAEFVWEQNGDPEGGRSLLPRVSVFQNGQLLCTLQRKQRQGTLWRQSLILPNLRIREVDNRLVYFQAHVSANLKLDHLSVTIPSTSPFFHLSLDHPWFGMSGEAFEMLIPPSIEIQ